MNVQAIALGLVVSVGCGSTHSPADDAGARRDAGAPGHDGGAEADAGFTVPARQTYSEIQCDERGTTLLAEIWPSTTGAECAPPPGLDDELLVLGLTGWDGMAGTFVVGETTARGTASASTGGSVETATGTITIEPFAVTPEVLTWNLDIGTGRADLRTCGHFYAYPCEPPPTCMPPPGGTLTGAEIAERLATWLWNDVPDDALIASASSGELSDPVRIEAHARRMIGDARFEAGMARLVGDWLQLAGPVDYEPPPDVLADLPAETSRFTAEVIRSRGDRRELLQAAWSIRNGNLSRWYGAAGAAEDWALVDITDEPRRGALTHASVMTWHEEPSARGTLIRSQLFCEAFPDLPGTEMEIPLDPTRTRREQYEELLISEPPCATCHRLIDPIGFAFEHFDESGVWRATDAGFAIDSSGELVGTDVDGPFADLPELLDRLAASDAVRRCIVTKWFTHALGHAPDECSLAHVHHRFRASGDEMRELLLAIAASPAFRVP